MINNNEDGGTLCWNKPLCVKAGKGPDAYRADLLTVVEHMMTRGAGVFLLGCTELPLAAEAVGLTFPVVDPTAELAKAAIRFCGFRVRAK